MRKFADDYFGHYISRIIQRIGNREGFDVCHFVNSCDELGKYRMFDLLMQMFLKKIL